MSPHYLNKKNVATFLYFIFTVCRDTIPELPDVSPLTCITSASFCRKSRTVHRNHHVQHNLYPDNIWWSTSVRKINHPFIIYPCICCEYPLKSTCASLLTFSIPQRHHSPLHPVGFRHKHLSALPVICSWQRNCSSVYIYDSVAHEPESIQMKLVESV